ncbi:MAG: tetratricopeptide (TPR) repeat protein [Candidatus Paceibacteria bacterium]|jgi:tetratricopeptide (TPR) repeat protein
MPPYHLSPPSCMHRLYPLLILALGLLLQLARPAGVQAQGSSSSFEQAHVAATKRSQTGDWSGARKAWLELLRTHAGATYARPYLPEIRVAVRRAAFWSDHRRPDAKSLITGKLLRYSRSAGKIRVSYTPAQLADFAPIANYLLHPAHFTGTYTLEVEGTLEELSGVTLLVGMQAGNGYMVKAGLNIKGALTFQNHQISRIQNGTPVLLEKAKPKEREIGRSPKRFKLKVSVSKNSIKVTYDRRAILSTSDTTIALGQFGILTPATFGVLTVDGDIGVSWIEDLIDSSVQIETLAFEKTYQEPPEFLAWEAGPVLKRSSRKLNELASQLPFPDLYTKLQRKQITRIQEWIDAGLGAQVEAEIRALPDPDFTPATRQFLLVLHALKLERYTQAVEAIEALAKLKRLEPEMQVLEAILNTRVERRDRAISLLEQLIQKRPDDPAFHAELAQLLLLGGKLDASRKRIDAGLAIAPGDVELHELRGQVAKASQGPSWSRVQRATGDFFEVAANIDSRTTRLIAREADQALAHYAQQLGALPSKNPKRKLYVFSGSQGYSKYIEGVEPANPENTLGVFSPRLKQILLWNQPELGHTMRVVRHEVMHSYTDVTLGEMPTWLSEGIAEYYAQAKQESGQWKLGLDVELHMGALKRLGLRKLSVEQLLTLSHEEFMANSQYSYPTSWALVHYLLHSTRTNRALFDELWKILEGEIDANSAVHQVFEKVNLERLDQDFWDDLERRLK